MRSKIAWLVSSTLVLGFMLVLASSLVSDVQATKELYSAAREKYGSEIKGCKHCHVKALPKEDDHESNDLGKWLVAEKERRNADEIDVAWIEEYPGKK